MKEVITWRELTAGMVLNSNGSGAYRVVKVLAQCLVRVEFLSTGFQKSYGREHVASGSISDPYAKTVLGVGYLGRSKERERRKTAMGMWIKILEKYIDGKSKVSVNWLNFSNFHKWYLRVYKEGMYIIKMNELNIYCPASMLVVDSYERAIIVSASRMRTHLFYDTVNDIEIEANNIRKLSRRLGVNSGDIFHLISGKCAKYKGITYIGEVKR